MFNVPSQLLQVLNQVFDMERKMAKMDNARSLQRNIKRIKSQFEEMNLQYHNPVGERYDETRTDCEATISGSSSNKLVITEVIKPIITIRLEGMQHIVQKAVVIVEAV